jgi:hypothetical protein
MTLVGASSYQQVQVRIQSQDVYTRVHKLAGAALPGGTGTWAFVVWGMIGRLADVIGRSTNAVAEVALGDQNGPFGDAFTTVKWDDIGLSVVSGSEIRGHPFIFCRTYDTVLSGARGTWNASKDLTLWARIARNGDSPANVGGEFSVGNVAMLAFRINALNLNQWFADRFTPASPASNNRQSQGYKNHWLSSILGVFDHVDSEWLVFSSTQYRPGNVATGAPFYETSVCPSGLWASAVPLIGERQRMGARARGTPAASFFNMGGMRTFTVANTNTQIGVRGFDWNAGPTETTSQIWKWETFAIRADALGQFLALTKTAATVGAIFNDFLFIPNAYEPLENVRSFVFDIQVAISGCWDASSTPGLTRTHVPTIVSGGGGYFTIGSLGGHTFQSTEGIHPMLGGLWGNVRSDDLQFRAAWWELPPAATGFPAARPAADFTLATWIWENDPQVDGVPVPTVGPIVVIQPGKEALGTSSLTAFPFEPERSWEEDPELVREILRAADASVITWPKFLGGRRLFNLEWVLTAADRDTLLAFFAAQDRGAVKWTPPHESAAVPLVRFSKPETEDVGLKHRVSASFLELVYVGS